MLVNDMNAWTREIQIKVRLNQAELDALKKIAALQGIGKCEVLRGYIHQNAPK
jgi:predicted DNA binding CopG/RHH family protein